MHHTAPAIIHHQIIQQDPKPNQIPVILPNQNVRHQQFRFLNIERSNQTSLHHQQQTTTEQILIPSQISPAAQQTVVINPQNSIGNIFVRHKRPPQQQQQPQQVQQVQQVFQHQQVQPLNGALLASMNQQQSNQLAQQQQQQQLRQRQLQTNKTPPGSVNLERSYQICQAVIQNSSNPNRQQLNNQLKVPTNFMAQKKF